MKHLLILVAAAAVLLAAMGCSRDEPADTESLPDALELLSAAAERMDEVSSLSFELTVEGGGSSNFQVTEAGGVITDEGDVRAIALVMQAGRLVEYSYVVVDGVPYLKGPTGGFRRVPAAIYRSFFDPATLLGDQRSLSSALASIEQATTEGSEEVAGVDTYRIQAEQHASEIEGLSLLASGVEGDSTLWLAVDDNRLIQAQIPFLLVGQDVETVVTLTLADHDAPVEIEAPV